MNTHDKYELPPLPEPFTYTRPGKTEGALYHAGHMQAYARAALEPYAKRIAELEADRERRGEPVSGDRQMLLKLMGAFDTETWQCPSCGYAEDTATMDSAYMLRDYLKDTAGTDPVKTTRPDGGIDADGFFAQIGAEPVKMPSDEDMAALKTAEAFNADIPVTEQEEEEWKRLEDRK